ncbi:unnamed protein product [Citrullus colocynthis]|uniref:Uncharacterized protein n=1 Tax=Citrullus colocynthis TaxID=252529 RepID=A0ABP0XLD7_9ROSI
MKLCSDEPFVLRWLAPVHTLLKQFSNGSICLKVPACSLSHMIAHKQFMRLALPAGSLFHVLKFTILNKTQNFYRLRVSGLPWLCVAICILLCRMDSSLLVNERPSTRIICRDGHFKAAYFIHFP